MSIFCFIQFFIGMILYSKLCFAYDYMYPVATLDNETLLYIHQYNPTTIQLFSLNTTNNVNEQMLWSLYTPAQIKMLPDNQGFSFIDNGRLRIQLFDKRSPKTIDFEEPIYNIQLTSWITNHIAYASAHYNDHTALFELHDDGSLQLLYAHPEKDYMYPQKINSTLFFIERSIGANKIFNYSIMQGEYSIGKSGENYDSIKTVIDFKEKPIIFLTMISETEGFVLEHQKKVGSEDFTLLFCYHHISKDKKGQSWKKSMLFSFEIPASLVLPNREECLFESIIPLLPRLINHSIHFVSCAYNRKNILEPYYYDLKTQEIKKSIESTHDQHYFVPLFFNGQLCFGGGEKITFSNF